MPMDKPTYILGIGLITAQASGIDSNWTALLDGKILSDHGGAVIPRNEQTRVAQLAKIAAIEAIADAGWDDHVIRHPRTALVIGTSKGPVDDWLAARDRGETADTHCGIAGLASSLSNRLGLTGVRETWSAACASGLYALWQAQNLLRRGVCDRAIVVAAESSLHPLFIATFDRLGVLAKPGYGCRPFDETRDGFVMSEAAAAVCLGLTPYQCPLRLEHVAVASDAYHITGVDPSGEALRHVIRQAAGDAAIDFVHAHGTATQANDPAELAAIEAVVGQYRPHVFSHKAAFGHTQGAAGLIGVVCNAQAHRRGQVPPNSATRQPIAHTTVVLNATPADRSVRESLVLAAGFGGSIAAARLSSS
jgi:3-oxoacyl-[acyl-carrier-protein] synthase II